MDIAWYGEKRIKKKIIGIVDHSIILRFLCNFNLSFL